MTTRCTALQRLRVSQPGASPGDHPDLVFSLSHEPLRAARPHASAPLHGPAMQMLDGPLTAPSSRQPLGQRMLHGRVAQQRRFKEPSGLDLSGLQVAALASDEVRRCDAHTGKAHVRRNP